MTQEEAAIDYCLFIGNTSLDEVDAFKAGALETLNNHIGISDAK